jgi:hypothetical protein
LVSRYILLCHEIEKKMLRVQFFIEVFLNVLISSIF